MGYQLHVYCGNYTKYNAVVKAVINATMKEKGKKNKHTTVPSNN